MDAMSREMENLKVSLGILQDGAKIKVSCSKAFGRLVFDARMTLEQKDRWDKYGHRNPGNECSTFDAVVSRDSVRTVLTYCALNDFPTCASDTQNDCL